MEFVNGFRITSLIYHIIMENKSHVWHHQPEITLHVIYLYFPLVFLWFSYGQWENHRTSINSQLLQPLHAGQAGQRQGPPSRLTGNTAPVHRSEGRPGDLVQNVQMSSQNDRTKTWFHRFHSGYNTNNSGYIWVISSDIWSFLVGGKVTILKHHGVKVNGFRMTCPIWNGQ